MKLYSRYLEVERAPGNMKMNQEPMREVHLEFASFFLPLAFRTIEY